MKLPRQRPVLNMLLKRSKELTSGMPQPNFEIGQEVVIADDAPGCYGGELGTIVSRFNKHTHPNVAWIVRLAGLSAQVWYDEQWLNDAKAWRKKQSDAALHKTHSMAAEDLVVLVGRNILFRDPKTGDRTLAFVKEYKLGGDEPTLTVQLFDSDCNYTMRLKEALLNMTFNPFDPTDHDATEFLRPDKTTKSGQEPPIRWVPIGSGYILLLNGAPTRCRNCGAIHEYSRKTTESVRNDCACSRVKPTTFDELIKSYKPEYRATKDDEPLEGYKVWRWPEFIAFAKRLGIDLKQGVRHLNIDLPCHESVTVKTETYGVDKSNPRPESE